MARRTTTPVATTTAAPPTRGRVASLRVASLLLSGVLVAVTPALRGVPHGLDPAPGTGSVASAGR